MHEFSLIKNMLSVVARVREEHGGREVAKITVEISDFGGLTEEHFRFHFQEACSGTPWEGLEVEIRRVPFGEEARLTGVTLKGTS